MRKIEKPKKHRSIPFIVLGALCFIVSGAATYYFGYVRPRLNAAPVKVYKLAPSVQKEAIETSEKVPTSVPTTTDMDASQEVSPETDVTMSLPTSELSDTGVETSAPANFPDEDGKTMSEQDKQKRVAAANQAEIERIEAEKERILKLVDDALARGDIYEELIDKILPNSVNGEGVLDAEQRSQIHLHFTRAIPLLANQLKSLPPERQRALFERFKSMVDSTIADPVQAEKLKNQSLELFREHGIQF